MLFCPIYCSHNKHTFMKYTQIFVCIIARRQITRDRAMRANGHRKYIFRRKYDLVGILKGGDFLRDQLVWVLTMEYLMSGKLLISLVSCVP